MHQGPTAHTRKAAKKHHQDIRPPDVLLMPAVELLAGANCNKARRVLAHASTKQTLVIKKKHLRKIGKQTFFSQRTGIFKFVTGGLPSGLLVWTSKLPTNSKSPQILQEFQCLTQNMWGNVVSNKYVFSNLFHASGPSQPGAAFRQGTAGQVECQKFCTQSGNHFIVKSGSRNGVAAYTHLGYHPTCQMQRNVLFFLGNSFHNFTRSSCETRFKLKVFSIGDSCTYYFLYGTQTCNMIAKTLLKHLFSELGLLPCQQLSRSDDRPAQNRLRAHGHT